MNTSHPQRFKTTIPLPELVGESRLLYAWCQKDKEEFLAVGFDWEIIESLPSLDEKAERLYIQCKVEKINIFEQKRALALQFKEASLIRTEITNKLRYSLYTVESTIKIPGYSRNRTQAAIIGNLRNLAGFCEHFKDPLSKINFDMNQVDSIIALADNLQNESSRLQRRELEYEKLRERYIAAYRELYATAQQIRRCAFEIFPPESHRRKGYRSKYRESLRVKPR